ncbi:MAG: hypothetical protein JNL59_09755, partial [Chitinophagaceae bacterium]|nr:hypothetical protein [Chitinophagaceae bacterium]
MDIQCTPLEKEMLARVARAAASLQTPAYLIGGFVRDKLLGRITKDA